MTDPSGQIGKNIRQRRRHLGLSLDALADRSGVSTAMLSEVERAMKNPTVKLAWQIANALECALTDLLAVADAPEVHLVRAGDRRTLVDPETGVERHGLRTRLLNDGLEVVSYRLPPGEGSGEMEPNRPGVREHLIVLGGILTLHTGDTELKLRKGDQVTYAPQTTVAYVNDGARPCEFLLLSDRSRART
ncbi:MAG: hypothetical protein CMJ83_07815 [Planctomycetes bacterium]|nr:hypothetical protein [Planctomycetota bacterium]